MAKASLSTRDGSAAKEPRRKGNLPSQTTTADPFLRALQWRWFQRIWAAFCLLLVAVSWRLWIPQQVFPQVPFFSALRHTPALADWALLLALVGGLLGATVFVRPGGQRSAALIVFGVAMLGLVLLDQHRMQAWAYQGLVITVLLLGTPPQLGMTLLRVFAVSVYFHSAAGKFDFQFLHTVGQQFLETAGGLLGLQVENWDAATRVRAAVLLPVVELTLAAGALIPATRRWAGWGLVVMHSMLLVLLGPLGLQHQPGVLAWNGFFIAQALVLFVGWVPTRRRAREGGADVVAQRFPWWWRAWALPVLFVAVLSLPLTERFGFWDHWPSWALYSPHSSRVEFSIHASRIDRLPETLQPYLEPDENQTGWHELAIDRWSIEALGVPVYPQARFQLGVVLAILDRADFDDAVRLRLRGVAGRWDGQREEVFFGGRQGIQKAADAFWLNVEPRGRWK